MYLLISVSRAEVFYRINVLRNFLKVTRSFIAFLSIDLQELSYRTYLGDYVDTQYYFRLKFNCMPDNNSA